MTKAEAPPNRIWLHELAEMLAWYEKTLCEAELRDPRGHRVKFAPERFPHLIKLLKKGSKNEVENPQRVVNEIRSGLKKNADFGGYHAERFQGLSWMSAIIQRPTRILEVSTLLKKPGDTLYLKEFDRKGYAYKLLICRRAGKELLVPVTCHPREHDRFGKDHKTVWPL
jgi:hypothetical protein